MTTSSLRIVAAGVAVTFAVFTGLFTGMAAAGTRQCVGVDGPSGQQPGQSQNQATPGTADRDDAPDDDQVSAEPRQSRQTPGDDPTQPGPGAGLPGGGTGGAIVLRPDTVAAGTQCGGGFAPAALVGFLGALLAGGAVAVLLFVRRSDPAPAPVAAPAESPNGQVSGERTTLVQSCIYVRDRVTSKALADRLGWALQEVGVTTLAPTGQRFDPARHEAGGSATTTDPSQVGRIAAVEVPGYVDRGVVLRAPVVTVYRSDGQ